MAVSAVSRAACVLAAAFTLPLAPLWVKAADVVPRVISINLCTDQLVMLLANPEQILGLSPLSRDAAGSFFHQRAQQFRQVEPIAEEILPLAPDMVIAGPFTSRYTLRLLDDLGIRVQTVPIANSIEAMFTNIELLGRLLGQTQRASVIVDDLNRRLDAAALRVKSWDSEARPSVAVFDANGYTVGQNTVRGETISLSGWDNVASREDIDSYGVLGLEQLVALQPQALIESPYSDATYSRGQMLAQHPAIRASGLDPLMIRVPSNMTICAGPWTLDVVEKLLDARANFQ